MQAVTFRPNSRTLDDALSKATSFQTKAELQDWIQKRFQYGSRLKEVVIEYYCYDRRIKWDTWIVTVKLNDEDGERVIGYTNGELK